MNRNSGMTVVEATIVLAILLLLAAIAVPAFIQNAQKKRAAQCAMHLDAVASACRRYAAEERAYPTNLSSLVPAYLRAVPQCPSGGSYSLGAADSSPPICSIPGHHL